MKKLLSTGKLVALAAGLVSIAQVASADTVSYTYTGETGGGVSMDIKINGSSQGTYASVGQFIMTTSNPNYSSTLLTYCTDIGAVLANTYNYTPTALGSATGVAPAWITGGIQNVAKLWYNDQNAPLAAGQTAATQTAGLQLAIWELLYNNITPGSFTTSQFSSSSNKGFQLVTTYDASAVSLAEQYACSVLNNLNNLPAEQNVEWLAPTSSTGKTTGSQGLLYETTGTKTVGGPDATTTLPLLGFAVTALGLARRKFKA
ncbi:MAG TPA: hypothetical protein VH413_12300 [Verrucomicrobiae bacterium]|nr:hypothetical protein [Verrucomicrobiae bacterium]